MNEIAHLLQFFLLDELKWVESLDFRRNVHGKARGIKMGDGRHAALAGQEILPRLRRVEADGGEQSHTGYNDSPVQAILLLLD